MHRNVKERTANRERQRKYRQDPEVRARFNANTRAWRAKNKDKVKDTNLRQTYGITLQDYHDMVLSQYGECAICEAQTKDLHVDHCHGTGVVRGLLCMSCNTLLGRLEANEHILDKAMAYREIWRL